MKILKGAEATKKVVGSEDAQVADHRESHEAINVAAAASHPMNSDVKETSREDVSSNKLSETIDLERIGMVA